MPEMDGFEATREIRGRERSSIGKRVPIIALTANAMAQDREECLSTGMDDHLSKPFSMQTMQDMLDRWMPQPASTKSAAAAELAARGPAKAAAALDRRVLDQLREDLGDAAALRDVISTFLERSPSMLTGLREAAARGDGVAVSAGAHAMKGTSATLGALTLSSLCAELERLARAGRMAEVVAQVPAVEAEYGSVDRALRLEAGRE